MLRLLPWLFGGIAVGSAVLLVFFAESKSFIYSTTLTISAVAAVASGIIVGFGNMRRSAAQRRAAIAAGRTGFARIDDVRRTGVLINDNPQVRADLTVSIHGQVYRTTIKTVIDLFHTAQFQVGSVHPVAQLSDDPRDIVLLSEKEVGSSMLRQPPMLPPADRVPSYDQLPGAMVAGRNPGRRSGGKLGAAVLKRLLAVTLGAAIMLAPHAGFVSSAIELSFKRLQGEKIELLLTEQEELLSAVDQLRQAAPSDELTNITIRGDILEAKVLERPGGNVERYITYGLPGTVGRSDIHVSDRAQAVIDPEGVFTFDDVPWDRLAEFHAAALKYTQDAGLEGTEEAEPYISILQLPVDEDLSMTSYFPTAHLLSVAYDRDGTILRTSPAATEIDPAPKLLESLDDLEAAMADLTELISERYPKPLEVSSVSVWPQRATITLPFDGDTSKNLADYYHWEQPGVRGGSGARTHDAPVVTTHEPTFELNDIHWVIVQEVTADALKRADANGSESSESSPESLYVRIRIPLGEDTPQVQVSVKVNQHYRSFIYDLSGTFIKGS
ncbi:hypothetical protein [Micrococcoides hystricis]|uniref:Uncharacterized protein n=1 Tax=Micrococcoides hystricis TaxID=1572761 RepID=A0ABV6PAP0_9MICC